jgi:hypothetical protein
VTSLLSSRSQCAADDVLAQAARLLDFSKPVGLLLVAVLHNIGDADDPAGIDARYMSALAPGSYVVISHSTDEFAPDRTHAASVAATERGATWLPRPKDEIARMFNGRDLVEPGLVLVPTGARRRSRAPVPTRPGPTVASPKSQARRRRHGALTDRRPGRRSGLIDAVLKDGPATSAPR